MASSTLIKYPRTYHLPWSHPSRDDKVMKDVSAFEGQEVVVSLKLDGENTSMYRDHIHARSLEFLTGETCGHVKALHAGIAHEIPEGWRLCGENLYAKHSIHYKGLRSYFMLFSVWNERNECLSWDDTETWARLLGLELVPVLYRGLWEENRIRSLVREEYDGNECEGYVVRLTKSFPYAKFKRSVAKYVRASHVTSDNHWRHAKIVPNQLAVCGPGEQ